MPINSNPSSIISYLTSTRGQSLIELLIVIALLAVILPVLAGGLIVSREGRPQQERRIAAAQHIQEAKTALQSIRENSWDSIATNGIYHPSHDGSSWSLSPGTVTINGIMYQVEISDVNRDNNHTIVSSGGYVDPSTKKAVITASWDTPLTTSIQSELYLTRYLDNATYIQTTEADFNTGTHTDTVVTDIDGTPTGGAVELGSGGGGNWCTPELTLASLDLPKQGVANAITTIEGEAFVGTGQNASGESLVNIDITDDNPPSASIIGTFDGYKTHDVFGENDYFYVAAHRPNREIIIVDISNPSNFNEVGYFNAPPNVEDGAQGVFVVGNVGYAVVINRLYTFDLSSKAGSRPMLDEVSLSGTGTSLYVVGDYAFVSVADSSQKMQIFDVSDPSSIIDVGFTNITSGNGKDVFVNETGTRAYVATEEDADSEEFFIIDTTDKTGNRPIIGSYDTNGMNPEGVTVVTGNKAILVGQGAEEYQVINIANEATPAHCGGLNIDTGVNGIASVLEADGDAYSYILTGDQSEEFRIIAGGPGGGFATSGIYESATFDVGYSTAFNRFIPIDTQPANTTLEYQIAIADAVSGDCNLATYEFTGPDGTTATFYTTEEVITFDNDGSGYENPGRCFRYRGYLESTDSTSTPILEEITVNYSP